MTEPKGPLVLVVEDYQDAREMYAAYLQFAGFRVAEATNGLEAIEQSVELRPDIILIIGDRYEALAAAVAVAPRMTNTVVKPSTNAMEDSTTVA